MKKVVRLFLLSGLMVAGLSLSGVTAQVATPKDKGNKVEKTNDAKRMKAELGLSDEQVEKLKVVRKAHHEKMKTLKGQADKAKKDKKTERQAMNESFKAEVRTILTPDQYTKWEKMVEDKKTSKKATRKANKM